MIDGKKIRRLRQDMELSQAKLAAAAGLSQTTISRAERSSINLTMDKLDRIAGALGVEPGELLK